MPHTLPAGHPQVCERKRFLQYFGSGFFCPDRTFFLESGSGSTKKSGSLKKTSNNCNYKLKKLYSIISILNTILFGQVSPKPNNYKRISFMNIPLAEVC